MFPTIRQPLILLLLLGSFVAHQTRGETMKIQLEINGHRLQASLDDTPSGRDFYALLPLTLSVEAYADTETIGYLPRQLTTQGAPAGVDRRLVTSATTPPGAIWRCFIAILATPRG